MGREAKEREGEGGEGERKDGREAKERKGEGREGERREGREAKEGSRRKGKEGLKIGFKFPNL